MTNAIVIVLIVFNARKISSSIRAVLDLVLQKYGDLFRLGRNSFASGAVPLLLFLYINYTRSVQSGCTSVKDLRVLRCRTPTQDEDITLLHEGLIYRAYFCSMIFRVNHLIEGKFRGKWFRWRINCCNISFKILWVSISKFFWRFRKIT